MERYSGPNPCMRQAGHPHTVFPTSYAELLQITGGTPPTWPSN
jgi:hypothetical protein